MSALKIYVIGSLRPNSSALYSDLKHSAELLKADNVDVSSPAHVFEGVDVAALTRPEAMNMRQDVMLDSDLILLHDNYINDPDAELEAYIARALEMNVMPYNKYWNEQKR